MRSALSQVLFFQKLFTPLRGFKGVLLSFKCETQRGWVAHLESYSSLNKLLTQVLADVDLAVLVRELTLFSGCCKNPLFVTEVMELNTNGSNIPLADRGFCALCQS